MSETNEHIEVAIDALAVRRREEAQRLHFFDANVWLGRPQGFPWAAEMPVDAVATHLQRHFIEAALVSHWHSKTFSAQDGNRALTAALPALPAACGVIWTGLPLLPGETEPIPGWGGVPDRVCGIRIFPKTHVYPLAEWMLSELCEWMTARRLPLFVWHIEAEWSALRTLAQAFPRLTIVVESQPQKILYHARPLFALMLECPNLLVEISNFVGQGFIEYVVRECGPERLIFGSFLPVGDPLVPMGMLLDAGLDDAAKQLIAGDNLRRLLAEVKR